MLEVTAGFVDALHRHFVISNLLVQRHGLVVKLAVRVQSNTVPSTVELTTEPHGLNIGISGVISELNQCLC